MRSLLVAALLAWPMPAAAQAPTEVRLAELGAELASADAGTRERAFTALTTLGADAIPAITARLERIARRRPAPNWAFDVFLRIRRAAGASDEVVLDIAPGALAVLAETRHPRVLQMVEPLLLWRSLERIGTYDAVVAMGEVIGIDGNVWVWESRRVAERMGMATIAGAITLQRHENRWTRSWARLVIERQEAGNAGLLVQRLGTDRLADVIRAWGVERNPDAMRVIVSYVGHDRRRVRNAARWAMAQYGRNAIWTLRTAYRNRTGEHANRAWSHERTATELYTTMDRARNARVTRALEAGHRARAEGDLDAMRARYDDALRFVPELESASVVAEGFAALAEARALAGDGARARWAYRRALRIAPAHGAGPRWRAAIAFSEAVELRARGVVDQTAYQTVLALDPAHEGALAQVAESLVTDPVVQEASRRRYLGLAAMLALLGLALLVLGRRPLRSAQESIAAHEASMPTLDDADPTLPG